MLFEEIITIYSGNHMTPVNVICRENLLNVKSGGTERRGRVVNISAFYSGSPGLKSQPGDWISRLRFLWFYSVPPDKCQDNTGN
jgi:hypothetical protein